MPAHQLLPLAHKLLGHASYLLAGGGSLAAVDYRGSVTLGSIIVTCVILGLAALFTIRSHVARVWREDAEGQRAAKELLQEQLATERAERARFELEQQELRHKLKSDIAARDLQMAALEAKTDLTAAIEKIGELNAELASGFARQIAEVLAVSAARSEERDARTHELLEAIRDRLPDDIAASPR